MSIPLIQKPDKDDINTSIIAIKRNIERINMLLGLSNSEEIDTSKFATKEELQQAVTDLQPVNEVAVDNMQSVTSNAVASVIQRIKSYFTTEQPTGGKWIDGKPIYEIVITGLTFGDTINTWTNCGYTFSNCDTFIKGTARRTTDNATLSEICFCVTNNVLKYHTGIGFPNCNQVIAEYTKTTD